MTRYCLAAVLLLLWTVPEALAAGTPNAITLAVGSSRIVMGADISQVAISNPAVIDVQPISSVEVLLTALAPGTSQLFIWDKGRRVQHDVTAFVSDTDSQAAAGLIRTALADPNISVEAVGERVLLRGEVAGEGDKLNAETTAKAIYPKVDNLLIVKRGISKPTLEAINQIVSKMGAEAVQMPDGKIVVTGTVADPAAAARIQKALEPWSKDVEFVYNVSTTQTAQQQAVEGLKVATARWNLQALAAADGRVFLQGAVPDKATLTQVEALADGWPGVVVVSQVDIAGTAESPQILIRARVVELNRDDISDLGVEWSRLIFSQSSGGQSTFAAVDQPFIIGQPRSGPFPLFGGPPIEQLDSIGARVSALLQTKKAHLLSQPSLVTTSGTVANILVGGEIPIPVPQSGTGGSATITIEYKPFGISLNVLPTVGANGEIAMVVKPEVSDLDFAQGIIISGIVVPAIRTRRAEATVHVPSGCSIAIGGLFAKDYTKNTRALPLLSKIPILGNFFKSSHTDKTNSELLIIVTPEIVQTAGPSDMLQQQGTDLDWSRVPEPQPNPTPWRPMDRYPDKAP